MWSNLRVEVTVSEQDEVRSWRSPVSLWSGSHGDEGTKPEIGRLTSQNEKQKVTTQSYNRSRVHPVVYFCEKKNGTSLLLSSVQETQGWIIFSKSFSTSRTWVREVLKKRLESTRRRKTSYFREMSMVVNFRKQSLKDSPQEDFTIPLTW